MKKEAMRVLSDEEIKQIAGGKFEFDWKYFQHKEELQIECPICHAKGTLVSQHQGWLGHGDGTYTATDTCICSSCGAMVGIRPEEGQLVIVNFNRETLEYSEDTFPLDW